MDHWLTLPVFRRDIGTQNTVDCPLMKDWRAGRAAGHNIIPTSTEASEVRI